MKFFSALVIILLHNITSFSQDIKILKGKITDGAAVALSYASVSIYSNHQKTNALSNYNGEFELDMSNASDKDSLKITYTGYIPLFLSLKEVLKNNIQTYTLKESTIILNEVTVNPLMATQVLKEALKKSSEAYPSPLTLTGYYREYAKRENNKISRYADGLVNYYIERKKSKDPKITVSVNQSRVKELPLTEDEQEFTAIDNPLIDIKLIAGYIDPYVAAFTDSTKFKNYDYQLSVILQDNKEYYNISFKPIATNKEQPYTGHIYIDQETGLIMNILAEALSPSDSYIKSVSLLGITFGITKIKINIAYQLSDQYYYLSRSAVNFGSKISIKKESVQNDYSSEFFTKSIAIQNFPGSNNIYNKKTLYKRGNNFYYEFWKDNSLLPPNTQQEKVFLEN